MTESSIVFTLIVPTIGRTQELERLLQSIENQELRLFSRDQVEAIILDQNPSGMLDELRKKRFSFRTKWVDKKPEGQSAAKNLGLEHIRGRYVGFPDDDCTFAPHALERLYELFQHHDRLQALVVQAEDPDSGHSLLAYPRQEKLLKGPRDPNVFLGLQIGQFFQREALQRVGGFDPSFCSGSKWGSGEETDFLIRFLKLGFMARFFPETLVFHKLTSPAQMPPKKLEHYSVGFGALCRKHVLYKHFFFKLVKQLGGSALFLFTGRIHDASVAWRILSSRMRGFLAYGRPDK